MRRADVVAVALISLLLASAAVATRQDEITKARTVHCANNLKQLWIMQCNYMVQYGGSQKLMPRETGDAFWLKLSKEPTKLIDESLREIYQCPVENVDDEGCDYRGPASDVLKYADGDPVGADVDGNHGIGKGGNVIRKSGDVQTVGTNDALWAKAETKTSGGNKAIPPVRVDPAEETPKQRQAVVQMGHLLIGVVLYREFFGEMPKTLSLLVEKPKDAKGWPEGGFLLQGMLPKDPWGQPYWISYEEDELSAYSFGPNRRRDSSREGPRAGDDIRSPRLRVR